MDSMLYEFCGNVLFLNKTLLLQDLPVFTNCFLDTLPVWISCGYLWAASLPFVIFLRKHAEKPFPSTYLHFIKIALCIALICLEQLEFSFRLMYGHMCEGLHQLPSTSSIVALGVRTLTLLLATLLIEVQKRHGKRTSGVLFTFWFLLLCAESLTLYSNWTSQLRCITHFVFYIYFSLVFLQFFAHCFSYKTSIPSGDKVTCPQDLGSNLNRFTYTWMTSLVYKVFKKTYTREKMWKQTTGLQSTKIGASLELRWQKELEKNRRSPSKLDKVTVVVEGDADMSGSFGTESTPLLSQKEKQKLIETPKGRRANLVKVVLMENWFDILEFLFYSWFSLLAYCALPILLSYLIDFIDTKSTSGTPLWVGIFYALVVVVAMEGSSIFYNTQGHHTATVGLKIKHSLMYLIYRKALTVSKAENRISVGDVVNHMSVDCQRIQDSLFYSFYLPNSVVFIAAASYLLYNTVGGAATLGGMIVLFLFVPLNILIVHKQKIIQKQLLNIKGLRVRLMNEILSGIKVLKMYAWEYTFMEKIMDIREKEIRFLKQNATLMAVSTSIANHSPFMIHFVLLLIYVMMSSDKYVSSSTVFVSMSVIIIIKGPLTILPTLLNTLVQIIVLESAKRVGGWMKTVNTKDGAKMEMGPRSIRPVGLPGFNTLYLVEELGLSEDIIPVSRMHPASMNRFIYANDKLNKMPNSMLSLLRTVPPFSRPIIKYAYHDFVTSKDSKDDETLYDFISRRFDKDLANYLIDPMCRGIYAGDCRKLSVKSCFPVLHAAEENGGSVLKGLFAKSAKGKSKAPQKLSNLIVKKTNEKWATFSFKNGLQQLSDGLRDAVTQNPIVEIAMDSQCSDLSFSNGKALLTVNGDVINADNVISSVYAKDLAKCLGKENSGLADNLSKIPAVDAVVTCMEFDGKIELPGQGFGHLTPSFENSCVLGVIYDSCTFPEHDRPDKPSTRFTVMMGGSWMEDLKKLVPSMTEADLGKFAVNSIQAQLKIDREPVKIHTEIQRECIPQYVLGHNKVLESLFSGIKEGQLPLSLVGSSYKGPSVNDCINNARKEMERITGSTSLQ